MMKLMRPFAATSKLTATSGFDGGVILITSGYLVRLVKLVILLSVWRAIAGYGAVPGTGMTGRALLCYTLLASVFGEQLNPVTPATSALWEGSIVSRFTRPVPVIGGLIAETVGRWVPPLLFYSLPMVLLSPLLQVDLRPSGVAQGLLFLPSLLLASSLGFAVDILFAAFAMWLKNGCWAAYYIRVAFTALLSGTLIPFSILPPAVGSVFSVLPLGSLAGAPLSIYTGSGSPFRQIALQLIWNILFWALALRGFGRSRERMISYGG